MGDPTHSSHQQIKKSASQRMIPCSGCLVAPPRTRRHKLLYTAHSGCLGGFPQAGKLCLVGEVQCLSKVYHDGYSVSSTSLLAPLLPLPPAPAFFVGWGAGTLLREPGFPILDPVVCSWLAVSSPSPCWAPAQLSSAVTLVLALTLHPLELAPPGLLSTLMGPTHCFLCN